MFSQNSLDIKGVVVDANNKPIQYASVSLPTMFLGTSTTEEGKFMLSLSNSDFDSNDIIKVSSLGHETEKITIQDYIDLKDKVIVIGGGNIKSVKKEKQIVKPISATKAKSKLKVKSKSIAQPITKPKSAKDYIELAYKNLEKNTINTPHELKMIYRRFSTEDEKARFLVEHCINILDKGPLNGAYSGVEIVSGRKSEDHRLVKKKMNGHAVNQIGKKSPLREGINTDEYNWKVSGYSSYDGEQIAIVEGWHKQETPRYVRYYVGTKTYGVYKIETKQLNAVYVYQKDENGKLYLSYHKRTRTGRGKLTEADKKKLKTNKNTVKESYKHEAFVIGVKKLMPNKYDRSVYRVYHEDIGDIKTAYEPSFWRKLSIPPNTAFYNESIEELETISNLPIQKQFRRVN
ncbi:carboxypeptidase-like regulatory domain-containing protein [Algibacter sp.]|uniref:carboxypeptidase-like regulatory domain-containing protein n=1 Tax=Algibacter sp. TaxID=1872428 RepID=UPI003C7138F2